MEDKVLAKVEGKEIYASDVEQFKRDLGPQVAMQFESEQGFQQLLNELVNQELLYLEAKANKLDESQAYKAMAEKTLENLLKQYSMNLLIAGVTVDEEDVKEFYEKNKEQFVKPETAKASHILVDTEEEANDILNDIEEGLDFADAAKKHSKCNSKDVGGKLGEFGRGQMVKEFEEAVFDMKEGTISKPVKSQFGFHIIKLDKLNPAGISTFEEVAPELQQHVIAKKQQDVYLEKIEELKKEYKVEKIEE